MMNRRYGALWALVLLAGVAGCAMRSTPPEGWSAIVLDLRATDTVPAALPSLTIERPWVGFGLAEEVEGEDGEQRLAYRTPTRVQVRLRTGPLAEDPEAAAAEIIEVSGVDIGRPRSDAGGGPVVVALDPPGASLTLTGGPVEWPYSREHVVGGVARVTLARGFVNAVLDVEPEPTVYQLLHAALLGVGEADLRAYQALTLKPTLSQVVRLTQAEVSPSMIQAYDEAGYALTVDELIRLREAGVSVQNAVAFAKGGFSLGAEDLVRLHEAEVEPAYAIGLKDAGFASDVDQVLRVHEAGVAPSYAKAMRDLKVAPDDRDLIRLHAAQITPESVATYQQARYRVNAGQLVALKEAGVSANDALALRQAGYAFSLEDLAKLARWEVPAAFALSLISDEYEPLTADQIVDLRLRRVTPEMVRLLRQERGLNLAMPDESGREVSPLTDLPTPEPIGEVPAAEDADHDVEAAAEEAADERETVMPK